MNTLTKIVFGLLFMIASTSIGQDIHINWGQEMVLDNKVNGSMDYILDANSKYIYTMWTDLGGRGKLRKIIAFNKSTMKPAQEVGLYGYKENKKDKKLKKDLSYDMTVVYENALYVFWWKYNKTNSELYVESFDTELKKIASLKKIFEVAVDKKSDKAPSSFVLANSDLKEGKILIGGEMSGNAGEPIKIAFKELNSDLSFSNSIQIELPFAVIEEKKKRLFSSGQHRGLSSSYTYGDDGFLHIRTTFSYDRKETKEMKKDGTYEDRISLLYSSVNLSTGELKTNQIKFENKKLLNTRKSIENDVIKFYGFFSDTEIDSDGSTTHGIFYSELNSDYSVRKVKFNYFTKKQLKELFKNDDESKYANRSCSMSKGCSKKSDGAAKDSEDAAIADDYGIEYSINAGNGIYLFCSRERTYETRHCSTDSNGNQRCYSIYHNKKSNVTAFSLDADGELQWASNLDRYKHYQSGSSSVYYTRDVKVVKTEKGFIVIYEDDFDKKKDGKKYDKKRRPFKYAFFDLESGKYSKREHNVNSVNARKRERKSVTAANVKVFENQFYTTYTHYRTKPQWWWISWWVRTPSMLKGKGNFRRIDVPD